MTFPSTVLVLFVTILIFLPPIFFSYVVQHTTIEHQDEKIQVLKDEICRLNKIIETLKENKRACYIPPIDRPNLT